MMDLWQCALANDPARLTTLVTDGEVAVDERNDLGETALHLAASRGHDDVVQVLLLYGANVALQDWESGWTALHRSLYNAQLSTSLLLLRHARQHLGRAYMKEFLYDTRDFGHQSAMQLASSMSSERWKSVIEPELEQFLDPADLQDIVPPQQCGGMVYTFGKVDFQLGYHLPHVNVQSSPRLVTLPTTASVVQIAAGKFHTLALTSQGLVFAWGFGKGGRLGTGTEQDHVEPTLLSSIVSVARIAAGENHSLALTCSGQVFSWGSNRFGQLGHNSKSCCLVPRRVDALKNIPVVAIAASGTHSGAIALQDGAVFTWGLNKRGQLGRPDGFGTDQPNPTPERVDRLSAGHPRSVVPSHVRAESLAMSDVHTCVVLRGEAQGATHGDVWQVGYGSFVPTRVLFRKNKKEVMENENESDDAWRPRWHQRRDDIVSVACAPNHSIALAASGDVYTWGHNGDALSHDKKLSSVPGTPQRVALELYGPVVGVCASQDHCAVVTAAGELLSWGGGPQGVLGHGAGASWQPRPKRVHGARKVVAVAAGHQHTVLLVAPRLPVPEQEPKQEQFREQEQTPEQEPEPFLEPLPEPVPRRTPLKLRQLCESAIAPWIDLANVATVWKYASVHSQRRLQRYCEAYMARNWDALLEMGGKERLDALFELVLAATSAPPLLRPCPAPVPVPVSVPAAARVDKPSRKPSVSLEDKKPTQIPEPTLEETKTAPIEAATPAEPQIQPLTQPRSHSSSRKAKFVPLDAFLAEKTPVSTPRQAPSIPATPAPWAAATASPKPSPLLRPLASQPIAIPTALRALPRKDSVDSSTPKSSPALVPQHKHVLGHDGAERVPVSSFSLDAFIQNSSRNKKKNRSDSITKPPPTVGSWGSSNTATTAATSAKTLKEIQAEEAAERQRAEAAARARHGGGLRQTSSVNSWGLVPPPQTHISFEELQRREEEERCLREQFEIMAQIERAKQQREADLRRRAEKQGQNQNRTATAGTKSKAKAEKKPETTAARTEEPKEKNNGRSKKENRSKVESGPSENKKPARKKKMTNKTPQVDGGTTNTTAAA